MRWSKEWRIDQFCCLVGILQQEIGFVFPTLYVVKSVISCQMSSPKDLTVEVGVFLHVLSYAEEGSFYIVLIQQIENPGRHLGYGAIVESEIDRFLSGDTYPPAGFRKKKPIQVWWLLNKHKS